MTTQRRSDCCTLVISSLAVRFRGRLEMLQQIPLPRFTYGLMTPPSVSPLLARRRAGSASAHHSTRGGCASSAPASATLAVTERHASRSPRWRPCASAPTAGRVSCVKSVSVADQHRSQLTVLLKAWAADI